MASGNIDEPKNQRLASKKLWTSLGAAAVLVAWWLLSLSLGDILVASPWQTFTGFFRLLKTADFYRDLFITLERFALSLFFATAFGIVLGIMAGLQKRVKWLLEPLSWVLMSIPPVVLVMVAMLWFGMGGVQTIFVATIIIFPLIYANTVAGIESVDADLIEMARIYGASRKQMITEVYCPGIYSPLFAALSLAAGMGIRVIVLAEVLGASSGIGYAFSLARTNVDTPALFAWIIICLLIGSGINGMLFTPMKKRVLCWRNQ